MFNATFAQSMVSDIVDKALIFALAFVVIRSLPKRIIGRYEFATHSRPGRRRPSTLIQPNRPKRHSRRNESRLFRHAHRR